MQFRVCSSPTCDKLLLPLAYINRYTLPRNMKRAIRNLRDGKRKLESREANFLRSINTGLGNIPNPIFLECLSRTLQRNSSVYPASDHETPTRPALPHEAVILIFRLAEFHKPRSEPLLPFTPASQESVTARGPSKSQVVVAVAPPLTEHDRKTLCALRVGKLFCGIPFTC
jgi:hypothetical protein